MTLDNVAFELELLFYPFRCQRRRLCGFCLVCIHNFRRLQAVTPGCWRVKARQNALRRPAFVCVQFSVRSTPSHAVHVRECTVSRSLLMQMHRGLGSPVLDPFLPGPAGKSVSDVDQ
ncbi:run domain Beclin-1 interacting and cystein-rich containing protein-like protein [Anopheles sinensis]|uniref:Run domain Beclin-1 interacting and cystein-rich containing protein-like protein n=1 Tax=Anopheles sinensis TaxID=74873 RepID=A0A084WJF3_ANOSI|nr:run domain Beclin-1 interacting and cystein-rich containing protein-like protein [Anopheles sinensis]